MNLIIVSNILQSWIVMNIFDKHMPEYEDDTQEPEKKKKTMEMTGTKKP